ncbi:MAG: vanadium-dependent haloperoxidase [Acidiferrobacterales bacterium]|nr:vanadium-dependent haloperoxidase [Acidiferrobacterales bacterium]
MKRNFSTKRRAILKTAATASAVGLLPSLSACSVSNGSYLINNSSIDRTSTLFYWTDIMLQAVRDLEYSPLEASRVYAMAHLAGSLALGNQHAMQQELTVAVPDNLNPDISYGIAFSYACEEAIGRSLALSRRKFLRNSSEQFKSDSIEWGRKVANQVIASRIRDGAQKSLSSFYPSQYPKRDDELAWSPTGPFFGAKFGPDFESFQRGLRPGWGAQKTWCINSVTDYEAVVFPDKRSSEFQRQLEKVKELGGDKSQIRSAEQSEIALFWEDGPRGITVPGHFQLIALQLLNQRKLALKEQAKFIASVSLAQADAAIIAWHNKYKFDIIRPETAIRFTDSRFNLSALSSYQDSNWQSYIPSPPFPAYISGHSIFGAASCEILALIIGTDQISLSSTSPDQVNWRQLEGVTRSWRSLRAIAEENGVSREYGGVHWEIDNTEGLRLGYQLAKNVYQSNFGTAS